MFSLFLYKNKNIIKFVKQYINTDWLTTSSSVRRPSISMLHGTIRVFFFCALFYNHIILKTKITNLELNAITHSLSLGDSFIIGWISGGSIIAFWGILLLCLFIYTICKRRVRCMCNSMRLSLFLAETPQIQKYVERYWNELRKNKGDPMAV